jgi:L-amino acid N-acyltransferase
MLNIRPAIPSDAAATAALINDVILNTTISFKSSPTSARAQAQAIAQRNAGIAGYLVADAGGVHGLATCFPFRGGEGYCHTCENTIVLAEPARGKGAGRALMEALCDNARKAGMHAMVACVSAENSGGLAFHRAIGFELIGTLPQVGRKFDRWLDLHLLQKLL